MSCYTGISPKNPSKYVGPNVYICSIVSRERQPSGADYRQPETGKLYPIGSYWIIAKDPTSGVQGDLWYLSKIVSNIAFWVQIASGGGGDLNSIIVDAFTPPGTNPVLPTGGGAITVTGGQVAAGTTTNVVRTVSLAANTFTVQIQRTSAQAVTTIGANGVAHFNSNDFAVNSDGFVSLTNSQTDIGQTIGLQTINLSTIPLGAAGTYFFESRVAAYEATGPNAGGFSTFTTIRTNGVTATLIGDTDAILHVETAIMGVVVEMIASGNSAILQVTGVGGLTIDWAAETDFTYRG